MNLSVFILAAGLGERLRPITNYIPKPLLPILGKPVLQYILEKVTDFPIYKIGINLHHKKEAIETWIKQSSFHEKIKLFHEDTILGTGGALKNAEEFLRTSSFLVHNSDIFSDINLEELVSFHSSSKNLATLVVHDYPEFNKLLIDDEGFLRKIGEGEWSGKRGRYVAFTGIAVYQPEFLKFLSSGTSSVVNAWVKALSAGYKIGTYDVTGCSWNDIGTTISYVRTVFNELRKTGETVYIHPSFEWCSEVEIDGYVVIENIRNSPPPFFNKRGQGGFAECISMRNCIILPGTEFVIEKGGMDGWTFENCILGHGFRIDLNEKEIFGFPSDNAVLIGTGGSDREYYRIKVNGKSLVQMQCAGNDPDFKRHIEYARFFKRHSVPVPELLNFDTEKMIAYFEDFGDLSLYSWLKCTRKQAEIEKMYKKVLDALISIHTVANKNVSECPLLQNRIFDYDYLRWETSYFIERFAEGIKNIKMKNLPNLHSEFHHLALKVDSFTKAVMHRDYQSQNIMVTRGGIPRLLDYQGARIGPPAYDVVSILWDPYSRLDNGIREHLLKYYISKMKERSKLFAENEFEESILPCRLQRHMQALGAYGFLSTVKGKKYFLKHIPEGLRLLKEDVSLSKGAYPILFELVMQL
jgi:NDP-sugar pyrophosphorylase family protein/aminoglycoside/choline kinase family phosphotransferase